MDTPDSAIVNALRNQQPTAVARRSRRMTQKLFSVVGVFRGRASGACLSLDNFLARGGELFEDCPTVREVSLFSVVGREWELAACGRPAADVAAELGLTPAAVYSASARVLRRLRQEFRGLLD